METDATPPADVYLIRHGETEWSLSGRHTGTTDLPLTENGRRAAERVGRALAGRDFALVLTSPLRRARETCTLAGLGAVAELERDLAEWDYGAYEGLRTEEIRRGRPGWMVFRDGCPGGESPEEVAARADRVIARAHGTAGPVALFAHGHFLRVLAARWIGLSASHGARLLLDTATLSVLSAYQEVPALRSWNVPLAT
jgi:probable phosphoglycerate mutase